MSIVPYKLLYFYSDSCFHCKKISSDIDFMEKKIPTARIKEGEHKDIHEHFEVEYFPTIVFIDEKDKLIGKSVGAKQIERIIKKFK
mgnify:CR=1 FL=1|tara:strand:+ start:207 stop:464 length:258 start_codon:yes stop_codon:yes gene_type:complete